MATKTVKRTSTQKTAAQSKNPAKKAAKKVYMCRTCGKTTSEQKHLCRPGKPLEKTYACEYCGLPADNPRHICKPKAVELKYYCDGCGRVATSKSLLCQPKTIK